MTCCLGSQCARESRQNTKAKGQKLVPQESLYKPYLGYDHICQGFGELEEFSCALQLQSTVVLYIILDAIIYIRDLADVIAPILHAEISLQLTPALQHQFQSLTVVQLQV